MQEAAGHPLRSTESDALRELLDAFHNHVTSEAVVKSASAGRGGSDLITRVRRHLETCYKLLHVLCSIGDGTVKKYDRWF